MFEQIEAQRGWIPKRYAVWVAIAFAFVLGNFTGKIIGGSRPTDWTLTVAQMALFLVFTLWAAVSATRKVR